MKKENIFISDCGNFIALRIPGPYIISFDVWRVDGSEMWNGNRYVKVPGSKGYNPQSLYTEDHAMNTKIVGSWSNRGYEKRDGTWKEAFELLLYNLETKKSLSVAFHTPIKSLAPQYDRRRIAHADLVALRKVSV